MLRSVGSYSFKKVPLELSILINFKPIIFDLGAQKLSLNTFLYFAKLIYLE